MSEQLISVRHVAIVLGYFGTPLHFLSRDLFLKPGVSPLPSPLFLFLFAETIGPTATRFSVPL